ncbi:MAG: FkbM family methyltransferase [Phycisphaeraceae bacterium]
MTPDDIQRRWQAHQHARGAQPLMRWLRWRVDRKRAKWLGKDVEREVELFWGQPMTVLHPEHVSNKLARFGYFERGLTQVLIQRLKPGMVMYDIGAHFGYFSLLGSALVGPGGQVFSFEPTDATHARLLTNITRLDNVTPIKQAVYSETTELVFCDMGEKDSSLNHIRAKGEGGTSAGEVRVPAVSLDDFVKVHRPPDFVKVDAEGAEYAILQGMRGLLESRRPMITLEVGEYINQQTGNPPSRQSVDFLIDRGYAVFEFSDGAIRPHTPIDEYGYDNLLFCHPDGPGGAGRHA